MPRPIVIVSGNDPLEEIGGGHIVYARAHARAAALAGFEPHLFSVGREATVAETEIGTVHRIRSPWPAPPLPGVGYRTQLVWLHAPLLAAEVERFLQTTRGPQLVHGIGLWGCVAVAVSRRGRRPGTDVIPIVSAYTTYRHQRQGQRSGLRAHTRSRRIRILSRHLWSRLVVERYERRMHAGARLVIVNYESVRRLLDAQYGIGAKCRKLPYASERAFQPLEPAGPMEPDPAARRAAAAPLIVSVSRHDSRKGIDVLLSALAKLRASGVAFRACLVGGGALLADDRRMVQRLGLADTVEVTGFVPDSYVYLRRADVFVLPSLEEGSGSLSLLEALQAKVAVVASAVDGIPEDVTHEESALLVKPGDVEALTAALARALKDAALRARLAQAGHDTFVRRFSADAFARALGDVYEELGLSSKEAR